VWASLKGSWYEPRRTLWVRGILSWETLVAVMKAPLKNETWSQFALAEFDAFYVQVKIGITIPPRQDALVGRLSVCAFHSNAPLYLSRGTLGV